ncbi:MAG: UDP-N-acetylmuramoyl-L-alanine--D-glutamate ligase, partial [Propionibacteriaceae bacterium]|nr:UDP-N-acetylmuramoyl-L-alanine--D-glutamate ligase [Propionibacteriaceae bacterium]
AGALARQAPDVPVVVLDGTDRTVMADAVREAAGLSQPGDTVLLAPGCASRDIWTGYDVRGDDFAAAIAALEGGRP